MLPPGPQFPPHSPARPGTLTITTCPFSRLHMTPFQPYPLVFQPPPHGIGSQLLTLQP